MDFISSFGVQYKVEIENFTNQPLILVRGEIKSGHVQSPPKDISPGSRESTYNAHKMSWSPTGASGAVAYRIGASDTVVAISVTCPYTFILSSNTLALNFYQWDEAQIAKMHRNYIYDQMNGARDPGKNRSIVASHLYTFMMKQVNTSSEALWEHAIYQPSEYLCILLIQIGLHLNGRNP